MPGGRADDVSIRWRGRLLPPAPGAYTIVVASDDGVRLWLDGVLVIDDWTSHPVRETAVAVALEAGRAVDLRLDYFEGGGRAAAALSWSSNTIPRQIIPSNCMSSDLGAVAGTGSGLLGQYFAGTGFERLLLTRRDAAIDFDWGQGSPDPTVPAHNFSARWLGEFQTMFSEPTTLTARTDDGVRVWMDGALVIDAWTMHGATDYTHTFAAEAGRKYTVRMDFMQGAGDACAHLDLESFHSSRRSLTSQLYPIDGVVVRMPESSAVSPAFIEGMYEPDTTPSAKADGASLAIRLLSDTQFSFDAPLAPQHHTVVHVRSSTGAKHTGKIAWRPTPLVGEQAVILRAGDALLLEAVVNGTWRMERESGAFISPTTAKAGQRWAQPFAEPGNYRVIASNVHGADVAHLSVTAVAVQLPAVLAAEVGFARPIDAHVLPHGAPVAFFASEPTALELAVASPVGGDVRLDAKPLRRGRPVVLARIGGAYGPVVTAREIDEFTVDTKAIEAAMVVANLEIGATTVVMRPWVANVYFDLRMFAHTATFAGGARELTLNTSGTNPSTGAPLFERYLDESTGEVVGRALIELEVPRGESMYCFEWYASQINSPKVEISSLNSVNGCICTIEVGEGIFATQEASDERAANLAPQAASAGVWRQQVAENWIPKERFFKVSDSGCAKVDYKLRLEINPMCAAGDAIELSDVNGPYGSLPCTAQPGPIGLCYEQPFMRFSGTCALETPCKTCTGECYHRNVHTGINVQSNDVVVRDCKSSFEVRLPRHLKVVRVDLDGYSGVNGSSDNSTRDEMPAVVADNLVNAAEPQTVRGVPAQLTLTAESGTSMQVRVGSRHPDRVRVSLQPSVVVPVGQTLAQVIPATCVAASLTSSGCKGTALVYLYGIAPSASRADSVIEVQAKEVRTSCSGSDPWVIADTEAVSVVRVVAVDWLKLDDSLITDPNDHRSGTVGVKYFPDADLPTDGWHDLVQVRARIEPALSDVVVHLRSFDPDDPSADGNAVDADAFGGDNRFPSIFSAQPWLWQSLVTDSAGEVKTRIASTHQPGNNLRVAAYPGITQPLEALNDHIVRPNDDDVPAFGGKASKLLTIWRRLQAEFDSMGAEPSSYPNKSPDISTFILESHLATGTTSGGNISVELDTFGAMQAPAVDFYAGGLVVAAGRQWKVLSNTANSAFGDTITIEMPAADEALLPALYDTLVEIRDDDAPGQLPYYVGVTPMMANAYKEAYIRLFEDASLNTNRLVDFDLYLTDIDLATGFGWDNSQDVFTSESYWSAMCVTSYQAGPSENGDPNIGSSVLGIFPTGYNDENACTIFHEAIRDYLVDTGPLNETPAALAVRIGKAIEIVAAHEIGHSAGSSYVAHTPVGILADGADSNVDVHTTRFDDVALGIFRDVESW